MIIEAAMCSTPEGIETVISCTPVGQESLVVECSTPEGIETVISGGGSRFVSGRLSAQRPKASRR